MSGSVKSTKGKKTGFLIAAIVLSLLSIGYLCLTVFIRPISSWTSEDTVEYSATFSGSKRTDNGYLISTEEYLFSLLLQEDVLIDPTAIDELRPGEKIYFRFLKGTVDLVINEPYLTEMTAITFRTEVGKSSLLRVRMPLLKNLYRSLRSREPVPRRSRSFYRDCSMRYTG